MQDQDPMVSFCPSFNTYSSDRLSAIADRVRGEEWEVPDGNGLDERDQKNSETSHNEEEHNDDDFEFVLVRTNPDDCKTIGGDQNPEMFASYPVFPLFNQDLLLDYEIDSQSKDHDHDDDRVPLKKLFIEDRDPPSSSSSEADELEGIPPGTYCVWSPARLTSPSPSPSRCKKSNSTGSSSKQKWRLRDLFLRRCSSDSKESFIFFSPDNNNNNKKGSESNYNSELQSRDVTKFKLIGKRETTSKKKTKEKGEAGKAKEKVSAHVVFYVRNKAAKEGDKRRSYLPYRQDLVGFFANVNWLSRTSPSF